MNSTCVLLRPAYELREGRHTWEQLSSVTPLSAASAVMYASVLEKREGKGLLPLSSLRWQYVKVPIGVIDGFVRTLSKYVRYSGGDIERLMRTFPLGDYFSLSDEAEYYRPAWPFLNALQREQVRDSFKYALLRGVDRAQGLWGEISGLGVYWPAVAFGNEVLDGAHRLAALRGFCGPALKVYVWKGSA